MWCRQQDDADEPGRHHEHEEQRAPQEHGGRERAATASHTPATNTQTVNSANPTVTAAPPPTSSAVGARVSAAPTTRPGAPSHAGSASVPVAASRNTPTNGPASTCRRGCTEKRATTASSGSPSIRSHSTASSAGRRRPMPLRGAHIPGPPAQGRPRGAGPVPPVRPPGRAPVQPDGERGEGDQGQAPGHDRDDRLATRERRADRRRRTPRPGACSTFMFSTPAPTAKPIPAVPGWRGAAMIDRGARTRRVVTVLSGCSVCTEHPVERCHGAGAALSSDGTGSEISRRGAGGCADDLCGQP